MSLESKTDAAATEGCAPSAGYATAPQTLGPIVWRIGWDSRGHWVTGKHGHTNHLWLWLGPTRNQDRLTIYNLVIGPLGIAVGWRGWHTTEIGNAWKRSVAIPLWSFIQRARNKERSATLAEVLDQIERILQQGRRGQG